MLEAWGRLLFQHRKLVLFLGLAVLLAIGVAAVLGRGELSPTRIEGIEAQRGLDLLAKDLGRSTESSFTIIFSSADWEASDPRFVSALSTALAPLRKDPRVQVVETVTDVPGPLAAAWTSSDGHAVLAQITLAGSPRTAVGAFKALRRDWQPGPLTTTFTGPLAFRYDLDRVLEHDLIRAELITMPLTALLLLAVFGSWLAALLPIVVGGLAVAVSIAIVLLLAHVVDMPQYAINITSLVGLGVAIDYSLFLLSRYRDERQAGVEPQWAIERSLATAGRAVLFSGLSVGIGFGGLLFFPHSYLAALGLAGAIVVLCSVVVALTILPALLAAWGPRLERRPGKASMRVGLLGQGAFHQVARAVMARPILALVPAVAVLVLLGAPFRRLELASADARVLPRGTEARHGEDLLAAQFPSQAQNRIVLVAHFPTEPVLTAERVGALYDLSRRVARVPGVVRVESLVDLAPFLGKVQYQSLLTTQPPPIADLAYGIKRASGGRTIVLAAVTDAKPSSEAARWIVRALRKDRVVGDGELLVTGQTALDLDAQSFMAERAPRAALFVIVMTIVVLFLLLQSVLLPLKAAVMNLLSLTASFGALVWIFQEGHLRGILGFEPGPIEPTLPVILFCALFGLSMDYEVLLLARIQEEWRKSGDNTHAVAEGLERSGPLITGAAAIMVIVFAGFAFTNVVLLQAMGLCMALAVALDATLVRLVIVPATMRLFGKWNWWRP